MRQKKIRKIDEKTKDNVQIISIPNSRDDDSFIMRNNTTNDITNSLIKKKLEKTYNEFYIGLDEYYFISSKDIIREHNKYLIYISNNIFGFTQEFDRSENNFLLINSTAILVQTFLNILDYNNILFYTDIVVGITNNLFLGEILLFEVDDNLQKFKIYVNSSLLQQFLSTNLKNYSLNYSKDISSISNFIIGSQKYESDNTFLGQTNTMINNQEIILKIFIIADHSATHYLDKYKNSDTDWIHHSNFGTSTKYITTHNIFKISANIYTKNRNKPILTTLENSMTNFVNSVQSSQYLPVFQLNNNNFSTLIQNTF